MAFHRRTGNRFTAAIWPGFVDAITALLMVMIFLLTIFMVVQFVLSEEISTQDEELNLLNSQLNELADALGLEQGRADRLEARVATLGTSLEEANAEIEAQQSLIATLNAANAQQTAQIASFEEQVASLLAANSELTAELNTTIAERDATATELDATAAELAESLSQSEALNLALAQARSEIDAAAEAARLAAARREALEALVADLETQTEGQLAEIDRLQRQPPVARRLRLWWLIWRRKPKGNWPKLTAFKPPSPRKRPPVWLRPPRLRRCANALRMPMPS